MYQEYIKIYQDYDKETGERIPSGTPGMYYVNMVEDGWIEEKDILHLSKIVAGKQKGRTDCRDVIMISIGGMPVEDIVWGYECYTQAVRLGLGTKLNMWNQPIPFLQK